MTYQEFLEIQKHIEQSKVPSQYRPWDSSADVIDIKQVIARLLA